MLQCCLFSTLNRFHCLAYLHWSMHETLLHSFFYSGETYPYYILHCIKMAHCFTHTSNIITTKNIFSEFLILYISCYVTNFNSSLSYCTLTLLVKPQVYTNPHFSNKLFKSLSSVIRSDKCPHTKSTTSVHSGFVGSLEQTLDISLCLSPAGNYLIMPSGNLQIANATQDDEGAYKCAAYNPVTQEVKTSISADRLRIRRESPLWCWEAKTRFLMRLKPRITLKY